MPRRRAPKTRLPVAMRVHLARLFGEASLIARAEEMSDAELRRVLRKVLDHLYEYLNENVRTDEVHHLMLCSGLSAARKSLDEDEDFWPGYAEGITRFALVLMGDYPDHRQDRPGSRSSSFFGLQRLRSLHYSQSAAQKFETLVAAHLIPIPAFKGDPFHARDEFWTEHGRGPHTEEEFMQWYKNKFPHNYAMLF